MTSEEFNHQFDLMQKEVNKLREAEKLAYNLGYDASYCNGISWDEYNFQKQEIDALVGKDWPASVKEAFEKGGDQGYWES